MDKFLMDKDGHLTRNADYYKMNELERYKLVKFCVMATANLNDIEIECVDSKEFSNMSDDELLNEANWLDELLNK